MKKTIAGVLLAFLALSAQALQPYVAGNKVVAADLKSAVSGVEQQLTAAGFSVIGRHFPKGIGQHAAIVVTDAGLLEALKQVGGNAVAAMPVRVGVKADGGVSYVNLEYWLRAYLRKDYPKIEEAGKSAAARLQQVLGAGQPFGGDVKAEDLANYRYMFGMERFDDDKATLKEYASFDEAVKTIRENLGRGVASTAKVYELVIPERKLAVFGVAMNDGERGEGWWVNKIGADNIAALPWEVFVIDGKVKALYGRYRTALAWPSLGMGQFMGISSHPDATLDMLKHVAGAQ